MTGELCVMDHSGDTKITWDPDKKIEVDAARKMFEDMKAKGYYGYSVRDKDSLKGEVIHKFNPDLEKIIMAPPIQGGC